MTYFTFNGRDSSDFGVHISGSGTFDAPKRDIEAVSVPGRDGDLLFDNGRFNNIQVVYPAFIVSDFSRHFGDFRAFLLSNPGYHRLEDTYHPEEYRVAQFKGPIDPDLGALNRHGQFDVTFECKPQRFLKSGEEVAEYTADGFIQNPTLYASKPLIRAYGTGTFYIGAYGVTITAADGYTDIDCDIQDAFKGTTNCNGNIRLLSDGFPKIEPGTQGIDLTGITKLEITPRWYTI